jgi:two-component system nitrogen regulation response regulator NtrX
VSTASLRAESSVRGSVERWHPSSLERTAPPAKANPNLMITRNPLMRRLLSQLDQVAGASATVLISGESGTGKEVLARAVHERSHRRSEAFVSVNCACLADGLLESELFGHERGAFTGAIRQHAGRFELANGGTLFLDEIGVANARVQLRLLRVLQEREFERVGGSRTLRVDVRVVAATNVDLTEEVEAHRFRPDLFYRLNVLPFRLPPLRERADDIPLFVDHFVKRAAERNGRSIAGVEPELMDRLKSYGWPGNIRELENAVERMVVCARRSCLTVRDLPQELMDRDVTENPNELSASSFREAKEMFERRYLCAALRRHHGVISRVATDIGMSRKNLYMRLETLEINYDRFRS